MNREERRKFDKKLQKAGFSSEQRNNINVRLKTQDLKLTENPTTCWEGEKVKLDYNRITSYPDYSQLRPEYREFIEANKNKVFTVEFDPFKKERAIQNVDSMVQLEEDTTKPKWLFWAGDLIPIKGQRKPHVKTKEEIYMEGITKLIEEVRND